MPSHKPTQPSKLVLTDYTVVPKGDSFRFQNNFTRDYLLGLMHERAKQKWGSGVKVQSVSAEYQPHLWEDTEVMRVSAEYVKH